MSKMVQAVIFDMDGTLLDTEKLNVRFWMQAGKTKGFDITREDVLYIRSLAAPLSAQYFQSRFGPSFDFDDVREERRRLMKEHVETEGVEAKPYVKEILEYLRSKNIRTAVATATGEPRMRQYLKMVGIDGLLDRMICTSMVKNGKPAPDVYLYACSELDCRPEDCIAVEDAPNGVRSAYSAGCKVVFAEDLTPADETVNGMVIGSVKTLKGLENYI